MSEGSYSERLRNLSKAYYQSDIRFDEYRRQRKIIIDRIDEEYNGRKIDKRQETQENTEPPDDASVFMKTIAFFKNNDMDDKP